MLPLSGTEILELREKNAEYWLWLCSLRELYRMHIHGLLEYFVSPAELFCAPEKEINSCSGLNQSQKKAILGSRNVFDPIKINHELHASGIKFISLEDEEYPRRLKEIIDYPYGLFVKGRLPADEMPSAAVIGSRRCTHYGRKNAEKLGIVLAEHGIQVISGMALGIDGYAQMQTLETGGSSFGVLGSGVDICYPKYNRVLYHRLVEQGGVLSEYPPGREPLAHHFPIRNRIISGLADLLVIVEAKEKSGTLITADLALEQGKDIFAVPGRPDDPLSAGCNRLISQGAGILLEPEGVLEQLGISSKTGAKNKKNNILLETKENLVYSCVDFIPKSIEELIGRTMLPVSELMAVLTLLEMKGYIEEPMKNYYAKPK